jgi:membrane-bound metal-dependent hydrolase YbcI (DUF457 family)
MAGLAHIGVGFAMKWVAPKAPVAALVVGAEVLDLLCIPAMLSRQGDTFVMITTHSLAASLVWSAAAMGIAALAKADRRSAIMIGLAVFSHWILDFITHPMGAIFGGKPLPPDLPLFFTASSPRVGLGLYNHSYALAVVFDIGLTLLGIAAYIAFKVRQKKASGEGILS